MLNKLLIVLSVMILVVSCSQKDTTDNISSWTELEVSEDGNTEESWEKDTLTVYDLDSVQRETWDIIKQDWDQKIYIPVLEKSGITISCDDCTGIRYRVNLHIDEDGRLIKYDILNAIYCATDPPEGFEEDLLNYFTTVNFGDLVSNLVLEAHLGALLKC
ncbi:MAG: hypothetical protein JKY54_04845 [Flavobacteriales bacterium]|nr:hypothetical protein [Flavobacteriales bacterium]